MLWSLAELVVCTKVRVSRQLASPGQVKGKVLLDLSEAGVSTTSLGDVLDRLVDVLSQIDRRWGDIAPWPKQKAVGS